MLYIATRVCGQDLGCISSPGGFFSRSLSHWITVIGKILFTRDIKLENTLLDASARPLVKLTDFGFTKNVMLSAAKTKVGTPNYTGMHGSSIACTVVPCLMYSQYTAGY